MQPPFHESTRNLWQRRLLRWLIDSLAVFAAVWLVPGIEFAGPGWQLGIVALILALLGSLLRPIFFLFALPLIILTLGLFVLVINAALLGLTSAFSDMIGIAFHVDGFWSAVLGGLVISLVSNLLAALSGINTVHISMHHHNPRD